VTDLLSSTRPAAHGRIEHQGFPAKPLDSRARLEDCMHILAAGQPLPPSSRAWLVLAIRKRLADPDANLDQLLGLRSRRGGRLGAFSTNPERDQAIRALATADGPLTARAQALVMRVKAHRRQPDPELARIEARSGRIPGSLSQLQRIIAGRTRASQIGR